MGGEGGGEGKNEILSNVGEWDGGGGGGGGGGGRGVRSVLDVQSLFYY